MHVNENLENWFVEYIEKSDMVNVIFILNFAYDETPEYVPTKNILDHYKDIKWTSL